MWSLPIIILVLFCKKAVTGTCVVRAEELKGYNTSSLTTVRIAIVWQAKKWRQTNSMLVLRGGVVCLGEQVGDFCTEHVITTYFTRLSRLEVVTNQDKTRLLVFHPFRLTFILMVSWNAGGIQELEREARTALKYVTLRGWLRFKTTKLQQSIGVLYSIGRTCILKISTKKTKS